MKGRKLSEETKTKMREAKKGQAKIEGSGRPYQKISVLDIQNNFTTDYDSMTEAARALNIKIGNLSRRLKLNITKPYKKRYIITKC